MVQHLDRSVVNDLNFHFNTTPEGIELLHEILDAAATAVVPDWRDREELPVELQETVVQVAGTLIVEVIRLSEEAED